MPSLRDMTSVGGGEEANGCLLARCNMPPSALFHLLLMLQMAWVRGQPFRGLRVKLHLMNMEERHSQGTIWSNLLESKQMSLPRGAILAALLWISQDTKTCLLMPTPTTLFTLFTENAEIFRIILTLFLCKNDVNKKHICAPALRHLKTEYTH